MFKNKCYSQQSLVQRCIVHVVIRNGTVHINKPSSVKVKQRKT